MKRPRRKRSLFPVVADPAVVDDPNELIRSGFPELTRCDHCGALDHHTQHMDINGELRWLHEDCTVDFRAVENYPVMYMGSGIYAIDPPEDEKPEDWKGGQRIGAVVKLNDRWYGFRHNGSSRLTVGNENGYDDLDDLLADFRFYLPSHQAGKIIKIIKHGRFQLVESVKWCGGLVRCACHGDGIIDMARGDDRRTAVDGKMKAHRFRWEHSEIVMRKVKRL